MATTKTLRSLTLGLRVWTEQDRHYFHVRARPVIIGLRPDEIHAVDRGEPISPDAGRAERLSSPDDYTAINGLWLNNLQANSQGNHNDATRHLYGFGVDYRNVFAVELRDAQRFAKTLATIEKRIDKLNVKYGHPSTFGQYLLRVADAIGATRFVFDSKKDGIMIRSLEDGHYRVDGIVREWANESATVAS